MRSIYFQYVHCLVIVTLMSYETDRRQGQAGNHQNYTNRYGNLRLYMMIRPRPTVRGQMCTLYQWHFSATLRYEVSKQRMGSAHAPSHHYWCGAAGC